MSKDLHVTPGEDRSAQQRPQSPLQGEGQQPGQSLAAYLSNAGNALLCSDAAVAAGIHAIQRTVGNRATQRLLVDQRAAPVTASQRIIQRHLDEDSQVTVWNRLCLYAEHIGYSQRIVQRAFHILNRRHSKLDAALADIENALSEAIDQLHAPQEIEGLESSPPPQQTGSIHAQDETAFFYSPPPHMEGSGSHVTPMEESGTSSAFMEQSDTGTMQTATPAIVDWYANREMNNFLMGYDQWNRLWILNPHEPTKLALWEGSEDLTFYPIGDWQRHGYAPPAPPQPLSDAERILSGITTLNVLRPYIQSIVIMGNLHEAWQLLDAWNTTHLDQWINPDETELKGHARPTGAPVEEREKSEEQEKKKVTLQIRGRSFQAEMFSDVGGFHLIYRITDDQQLFSDVSNDQFLIRVPRELPQKHIAQGLAQYKTLSDRVPLPQIYNFSTAQEEGFYLVERIPVECDPSVWGRKRGQIPPGFYDLRPEHQDQLKRIKKYLTDIAQAGREIIPDFRPDNIRFRQNGQLVLIDFSEDTAAERPPSTLTPEQHFALKIRMFTRNFAGEVPEKQSSLNEAIYNFLRSDFPVRLIHLMDTTDPNLLFTK